MSKKNVLTITNLRAAINGKNILRGINLTVPTGKIVALMGPNGSGKSTLCNVLMGQPDYKVNGGKATLDGKNLLKLSTNLRAKAGLFLSFQHPPEVPGVNFFEFLLSAYQTQNGKTSLKIFNQRLAAALKSLKLSDKFLTRSLNEGFSGGEKKKAELLQLLVLQPQIAILDETDSGLDIDALKLLAKTIREQAKRGTGFLVITHYQRLLSYLKPDQVLILTDGKITASGGAALVKKLEQHGYANFKK